MLSESPGYGLHVLCYDIANDKRRRRVVREVEAYGLRVQESVFECWIDHRQARELLAALKKIIRQSEDSIALYNASAGEEEPMIAGGGNGLSEDRSNWLV